MTNDFSDLDDLIDEFVTESVEWLDTAVDDILSLEKKPDQEAIDRIFRVVHTIKGTANMFNLKGLAGFVHSFEDICSDIRSGEREVDKHVADGLLKCMDFIRSNLEFIGDTHQETGDWSKGEAFLKDLQNSPAMCEARRDEEPARATPAPPKAGPGGVFLHLGEDGDNPAQPDDDMATSPILAERNIAGKALIVEDDFSNRNLLYSFLSKFMDCHVAKDGSEAIQAVTESFLGPCPEPFSLIVMDVMMPIIDGLQATQAIRAMERAKGVGILHTAAKIFIATALDDHETMDRAIHECGADDYMVKPMNFRTMKQILVQHKLLPPDQFKEIPNKGPLSGQICQAHG